MILYHLLSRRNDLKALLKGRLPQRLVRRTIYKHAFRAAGFMSRLLRVSR
jgi:hypothetical protein